MPLSFSLHSPPSTLHPPHSTFITMHIVEIPSFFPPYGGEFCLEQSKALRTLGHEVRIISNVQLSVRRSPWEFISLPYRRRFTEIQGVPLYQSYMRGLPMMIRPNVNRWVEIVRSMYREYVNRYGRPDILHAHCAKWAGYAAMLISEEEKIPYVVTEHLSSMALREEFGDDPEHTWQVPLLRKVYEHADRVIPVSEEVVDDLSPFFGNNYRWTAISNMIDVSFFSYRQREGREGRPFRFVCLGNFIYRKGYDILFEAFRMVHDQHPQTELYIAGEGTDGSACRKMFSQLSSAPQIHPCGNLDQQAVRELLYQSDALVLATRDETQGLVLLEAMSTGIPVVTTEAVPQNVRIEKGCYVAPVDDATVIAHRMCEVMLLPDGLGEDFSKSVRERVSPQVIAVQLDAVMKECVSSYSNKEA